MVRRSDLPALVLFAEVTARGSFRGAARALGLSPSAVSHAITGLEDALGVRLLARTTRSLAPTEAGRRLLERLRPALGEIEEAVDAALAEQGRISGLLRLTVSYSVAETVLVPLALGFMAAYPDAVVEIVADDGFVDIVADGFDAGIRFDDGLEQDMVAVRFGGPQRAAVVAAPGYLARHGRPLTPDDLAGHACIGRRFPSGRLYRWEFERDGAECIVDVSGALVLNDSRLMLQAVLGGAGIAYLMEPFVAAHVAQGRLVRLLEDWCPAFSGYCLYYPSRKQMRPVLRAFLDYCAREAATFGAATAGQPG